MCVMRKTAVPSAGILRWSCTELPSTALPPDKPVPIQSPGAEGHRHQSKHCLTAGQVRHIHRVIPTGATLMLPHHLLGEEGRTP